MSRPWILCLLLLALPAGAQPAMELHDGDRVVLLGGTYAERDQAYGYLETLLVSGYPDRNITFRNMGWSGDTVWITSRAGSGNMRGPQELAKDLASLKPTVVLVAYGMAESFDGEPGLAHFMQGYRQLLQTLGPLKVRVALVSPIRHENLPRPLPDPAAHNRQLQSYTNAIARLASDEHLPFVNLFANLSASSPTEPITDDGIHLRAYGYWKAALQTARELNIASPDRDIELTASASGGTLALQAPKRILLPIPPSPDGVSETGSIIRIKGLPAGQYTLKINGQAVATASASAFAQGVAHDRGPLVRQVQKLRATIFAKNRFFFDQQRPANDMYLFWGRRHEQGRNAREMPLFDPFIEAKEQEIAQLRGVHDVRFTIEAAH